MITYYLSKSPRNAEGEKEINSILKNKFKKINKMVLVRLQVKLINIKFIFIYLCIIYLFSYTLFLVHFFLCF